MEPRHVHYVWHAGARDVALPGPIAEWLKRYDDPTARPTVLLVPAQHLAGETPIRPHGDATATVCAALDEGALAATMRSAADDIVTTDVPEAVWQRRLVALTDLATLRRAVAQRHDTASSFFGRTTKTPKDEPRRASVLFVGAPGPQKLAVVDALLGWSVAAYAETVAHARNYLESAVFAAVVLTDPKDRAQLERDYLPLRATKGPGAPSFVVVRCADAAFSYEEALALGAAEVIDPLLPRDLMQRRLARAIHEAELRAELREDRAFGDAVDPVSGRIAHSAFHAFLQAALETRDSGRYGALLAISLEGLDDINREAGFAAGDRALAAAGQAIGSAMRAEDFIGRLDGSSFGVWINDIGEKALPTTAQRLQREVRQAWLGDAGPALSARVGLTRPVPGDDALSLSRRARGDARRSLLRIVS